MKFLFLNQTFHPDVMATAQYLSELAAALARRGHTVEIIASRRAYDEPEKWFPKTEVWRGVRIHRIPTTAFGKSAKWRRAADFGSFILACCWRLLFVRRPDVVVALTSPPLVSVIGALYARVLNAKFAYWVMDLNPDEAIAAGWLRQGSFMARILSSLSHFSFRQAARIVTLDHFMRDRVVAKGISTEKIVVLPPWSNGNEVCFDPVGREDFRSAHGLAGHFVIMYAGNHSPCHPLDTVLAAARELSVAPQFKFVFVGGGSEWRKINATTEPQPTGDEVRPFGELSVQAKNLEQRVARRPTIGAQNLNSGVSAQRGSNLVCLPYQPLNRLSSLLSAADLHVVVMGEPFVGIVHPCKIYNILAVGAPVLCIAPKPSHLTEILALLDPGRFRIVAHGDVSGCAAAIRELSARVERGGLERQEGPDDKFAVGRLLPALVAELEGL